MAYDALRNSILSGQLKPGEIYNEMSLAKELGISRTPVREALLELSNQQLVTFLPRKGVLINHPTAKDVEEIFELRKAVEVYAIEKVASMMPTCDLGKVEGALSAQRKALKNGDFQAYMAADRMFHMTFSELCNNRRLIGVVENMRDLMHLIGVKALGTEGRGDKVIAEHEEILEAVRRGDVAAAKNALERHLEQTKEAVGKLGSTSRGLG
jgi:DNA-binding GntR family transcriptional regulator